MTAARRVIPGPDRICCDYYREMTENHRIGDADRDAGVAALQEHYSAGRLNSTELDERLFRCMAATTVGELAAIFDDLPGGIPSPSGEIAQREQRLPQERAAKPTTSIEARVLNYLARHKTVSITVVWVVFLVMAQVLFDWFYVYMNPLTCMIPAALTALILFRRPNPPTVEGA